TASVVLPAPARLAARGVATIVPAASLALELLLHDGELALPLGGLARLSPRHRHLRCVMLPGVLGGGDAKIEERDLALGALADANGHHGRADAGAHVNRAHGRGRAPIAV